MASPNNENKMEQDGGEAKQKQHKRGRRAVELKKIKDKTALEVAFSKRRKGLFNKAAELSLLCGAQVAIIVFSPHDNPFVFGNPSAEALIDRYLGRGPSYMQNGEEFDEQLNCLKNEYNSALAELEATSKKVIQGGNNNSNSGSWWEQSPEGLEKEELECYIDCMEKLKEMVLKKITEMEQELSVSMLLGLQDFETIPSEPITGEFQIPL